MIGPVRAVLGGKMELRLPCLNVHSAGVLKGFLQLRHIVAYLPIRSSALCPRLLPSTKDVRFGRERQQRRAGKLSI